MIHKTHNPQNKGSNRQTRQKHQGLSRVMQLHNMPVWWMQNIHFTNGHFRTCNFLLYVLVCLCQPIICTKGVLCNTTRLVHWPCFCIWVLYCQCADHILLVVLPCHCWSIAADDDQRPHFNNDSYTRYLWKKLQKGGELIPCFSSATWRDRAVLIQWLGCLIVCSARPGVINLWPAGRIRPAKQNHPACGPFTKLQ